MSDDSVSILNSIYSQAIDGVALSESVKKLAEDYLSESGSLNSKVDSLIRWQIAKCATSGFVTGLGGLITLPITVPANLGANLYVQMRMSAAIAYMGGHDIYSDKVRTFVYVSLCGSSAMEILKEAGVQIATKIAVNVITKKITAEMIKNINKQVGFRLVTKAGSKGVINLVRAVPVIGGIFNGGFDAYTTNEIGETAKKIFIDS